jgi:hypothetical protein
LIVPIDAKSKVLQELGYHLFKTMHEQNGYTLIAYEGRSSINIDEANCFDFGVDRDDRWYICGRKDIGAIFNAQITMTIGFVAEIESRDKITENLEIYHLINAIKSNSQYIEEDINSNQQWSMRFGVELSKSLSIMRCLKKIACMFKSAGIEHMVAYFDGHAPEETGELDRTRNYVFIGPATYAEASWKGTMIESRQTKLVLTSDESLLDGEFIFSREMRV